MPADDENVSIISSDAKNRVQSDPLIRSSVIRNLFYKERKKNPRITLFFVMTYENSLRRSSVIRYLAY